MLINEINEKRAMNLKESENAHVRVWRKKERKDENDVIIWLYRISKIKSVKMSK